MDTFFWEIRKECARCARRKVSKKDLTVNVALTTPSFASKRQKTAMLKGDIKYKKGKVSE